MALVSHRRFPVDRAADSVAQFSTSVPLARNATIGSFFNTKTDTSLAFAGLLTLRNRNRIGDDSTELANVWDEEEIGCGGYGVVWVVRDPRTGKRVALKKMANIFLSPEHTKRAYRELKLLCSLKHENILTCCDILEPKDGFKDLFVVTELMETDLQRIIFSSQPLLSDHIKMFMYQILRGMKYLHSANVLHRDLKPSNLLVNSNCFLKICDFGLARIWDERNADGLSLTSEVVTEYYRAPELLMGSSKYNEAADVWSIGCIFAELLGRRILFLANGPFDQLNKIIDVFGTPTKSQMKYACESARNYVSKTLYRPSNLAKLYSLSSRATTEAVDLLVQLLKFDPDERISVESAIEYPYLQDARILYHRSLCSCCGYDFQMQVSVIPAIKLNLEPKAVRPFDVKWERELDKLSIWDMRRRIYSFIVDRSPFYGPVLTLNTKSVNYEKFMMATVVEQPEAEE